MSRGRPRKRIPKAVWLRLVAWAALVVLGIVVVRTSPLGELLREGRLVPLLNELQQAWWAPLVLISLYVVLSPLGMPVSPLFIGGAVFGTFYGTIYNSVGLLLGAVGSFLLAQLLGRDFAVRIGGARLHRVERLFERHGFWPLVQTRFLPLPAPVINYGAALAGVHLPLFVSSAVAGFLPSTLLHTYFISELFVTAGRERVMTGIAYGASFVVFNILLSIPTLKERARRRRRHRELLERRAARQPPP